MADIDAYKDKFSDSGQRIFQNALDESRKRDQNYITIGHVLNALTVEESDLFNDTMRDLAIDPRTVKMLIEKRIENGRQHTGKGFRIAPETTELFKKAMDRARGQGARRDRPARGTQAHRAPAARGGRAARLPPDADGDRSHPAAADAVGLHSQAVQGRAGHAAHLLEAAPLAELIGIDRDEDAVEESLANLASYSQRVRIARADFASLPSVLERLGIEKVRGVLFDLGVSSPQLDRPERGFSFRSEGPLDMRMDTSSSLSADTVVNEYPIAQVADGDEPELAADFVVPGCDIPRVFQKHVSPSHNSLRSSRRRWPTRRRRPSRRPGR